MSSSHMLGYSKSQQAKCHAPSPCKGSSLPPGTLRYGQMTRDNLTQSETIEWRHWGCVTSDILAELASATTIIGFAELRPADQQKVRTAIAARRVNAADIPLTARPTATVNQRNVSSTVQSGQKRKAPATPAMSMASAAQASTNRVTNSQVANSQSSSEEMGEDNVAEEVGDELIVSMRSQVVGIQYYKGLVGPGEEVILVREPQNRYDRNAVRVDNIGHTQVGHLPRAVAGKLAPLMDSRSITVEGVIHDGNLSGFRGYALDITLRMYGSSDRVPELQRQLKWATPGQRGFNNTASRQTTSRQSNSIAGPSAQPAPSRQSAAQLELAKKQQEAVQNAAELREILNTLEKVNDEGRRSSLLDSLCSTEDILSLPLYPNPPGIDSGELKVNLMKHQIQGLQWCIEREYPELPKKEADKPIQFWQLRRNGNKSYYYNLATKTPQESAPHLGRGALFADAMGLGKTLTMLSLIIATKKDIPQAFSNATLIVVPLSVLSNWEKQIQDHCTEGSLTFCSYYGNSRSQLSGEELAKYDVVLTTYQMVAGEHETTKEQSTKKKKKIERALFDVKWKRIVLDEGHCIRNPKTKIAKAVCALDAERRWILTGTPIINSPRDLGSLLMFLQICRPLDNEDFFKRLLLRPLKSGSPSGVELLRALMNQVCIRRTKEMQDSAGNALVPLPPVEVIVVPVALSDEARTLYNEVERLSSERFRSLMSGGTNAVIQSNALSMLTRMRQLALHPALIPSDYLEQLRQDNGIEGNVQNIVVTAEVKQRLQIRLAQAIEECEECPICFSIPSEPKITSCAHVFCFSCIQEVISRDPKCPMDRRPLTMNDLYDPLPPTDLTQPSLCPKSTEIEEGIRNAPSAKIEQLVHLLQLTPAGEKSLVFSQFTSFLGKIADALDKKGIPYVRFDGSMSAKKRQETIARFSKPLQDIPSQEQEAFTSAPRPKRAHKKVIQIDDDDCDRNDESDTDFVMPSSDHFNSDFEDEMASSNSGRKGKGKQEQSRFDSADELSSFGGTQQNPAVMLISLKAGALGLNLTVANNVYLMDPWWQEGIESQAIDRVNRIGQTKPVHVYQMISENTVESKVLDIQERKKKLIKEAFSGIKRTETQRQQREARLHDLIELFGIRQQEAASQRA